MLLITKLLKAKKNLLRVNGFNKGKIEEWEQNLIRTREKYNLEKFLIKHKSESANKRNLDQGHNNQGFHSPEMESGKKKKLLDDDNQYCSPKISRAFHKLDHDKSDHSLRKKSDSHKSEIRW